MRLNLKIIRLVGSSKWSHPCSLFHYSTTMVYNCSKIQ